MKVKLSSVFGFVLLLAMLVVWGCGSGKHAKGKVNETTTGASPTQTQTEQTNQIVPVSNSGLTFELEFVDQLKLENGQTQSWTQAFQQPYIDAANKWLNALLSIEGKGHHSIRMKIIVEQLDGGNGMAGPDAEVRIGQFNFPTAGTLTIGNHTYRTGFDQVEFKANILHEMGHIIGIGSFTEDFTEYYEPMKGNVLKVENSVAAKKYNEIYGNTFKYLPMSDDGGHLYDYIWQEDAQRRLPSGEVLAPLTKEFMANGATFGAVTLAALDDIGYQVNYQGTDAYNP